MTENNHFPENIIGVMDDFISHLNKTKKLFMILILSSFIVAPLSLVFAFILITPQVLTQAGEPYVVSVEAPGIMYERPQFVPSQFHNYSLAEIDSENATGTPITFEIVQIPDQDGQNLRGVMRAFPTGEDSVVYHKVIVAPLENQNSSESVWTVQEDVVVKYFPLKSIDVQSDEIHGAVSFSINKVPQAQPKFLFLNDPSNHGRQFDVTPFIFVLVIISSILASFWIYVGIREYKFFANWNKKYANYKKLQEKIDKELGD